jgi:hypothetical protein
VAPTELYALNYQLPRISIPERRSFGFNGKRDVRAICFKFSLYSHAPSRRRSVNAAYQRSLRKTSRIVESSVFSVKGLIITVAFTR